MTQRRSLPSQATAVSRSEEIYTCVRYILNREGSKRPIQRAEISRHLKSTGEKTDNEINNVIAAAGNLLLNVYGYKLEKLNIKGIQYIVILSEPCDSHLPRLIEVHEQRLLNVALTHILMSGGSVKDEDMWMFLIKAKLMEENDQANVKKLFTRKFVSQLYISSVKSGHGELAKTMFEWGPRACKETSKIFILNKIAEALGKTPEHWCEQHEAAKKEANLPDPSV